MLGLVRVVFSFLHHNSTGFRSYHLVLFLAEVFFEFIDDEFPSTY